MKAVILAGGLGTRLKPFTEVIPKPLLPMGEKTLLEVQIEQLKRNGFNEIYLALNYKADYIESYLKDGSKYNVKLYYSVENKTLGTCGPITLLKDKLTEPFLLMNGDILTKANFKNIYEFAVNFAESPLTIITKIITTPFRFGSIETNGNYITKVIEKPDLKFEILAGIYILKPDIFNYLSYNEYFGIDDLIKKLLKLKIPMTRYLLKDYWIDIGLVEDYEKARNIYNKNFKE
jgi:NDP-sugar pyrophosphorylase family protein